MERVPDRVSTRTVIGLRNCSLSILRYCLSVEQDSGRSTDVIETRHSIRSVNLRDGCSIPWNICGMLLCSNAVRGQDSGLKEVGKYTYVG